MIESHPSAPIGSVSEQSSWSPSDILPHHAVLCRNTAPLIATAFSFIAQRKACHVLGREIGQGLVALAKKLKPISLFDMERKLEEYEHKQLQKASDDPAKQAAVLDRCECLRVFVRNSKDLEDVESQITKMFEDKSGGVTFSTIHKAKGLEWETVYILNRWLMPSKYATQPHQQKQERNLIYVAITRAKLNLVYITTDGLRRSNN
jgi:DNA helicase II / ATP-dependent DNA helicase PcrA